MARIILADDDPGMRDVFHLIFKRAGHEATIYANGELLMENNYPLPDLFILDKQLSGINGLEVCRFLKSQDRSKNIPVIIISASPYVKQNVDASGADDFIEKPFKTKDLILLLGKHLSKNGAG